MTTFNIVGEFWCKSAPAETSLSNRKSFFAARVRSARFSSSRTQVQLQEYKMVQLIENSSWVLAPTI